ncbi:MAG: 3-deoxy-D-manno-octulosonic acid transferase [Cytophagaceae bacterium]|jgi:3-deoxy-D-manno-octulosonic-acid transferase|nr:3-deoxy-D-manno-octulosonic acid transferase [Cytophagaceae bacterium]
MKVAVYTLGIYIYSGLMRLAASFHRKAAWMVSGRKNTLGQLLAFRNTNPSPVLWFHCASLGEFEQGRPVMEALRKAYPKHALVVSFFSPSGFEIRKNYPGADFICYLPFDIPAQANAFVNILRPSLAIFVKYEFWYHHLHALKRAQVPLLLISANFRKEQIFFRWYGTFFRSLLTHFNFIFVQNKASAECLQIAGIGHHSISGDTRFDRVLAQRNMPAELNLLLSFCQNKRIIILGSAWEEDFQLFEPLLNDHDDSIKYIIAPHEIHETQLSSWQKRIPYPTLRYSQANENNVRHVRCLFIDSIGLLSSLYRVAHFAHIGGAFGKGLHNTLEAATFGMPISFGPRIQKFPEAYLLIEEGIGRCIQQEQELRAYLAEALEPGYNQRIKHHSQKWVEQQAGATQSIVQYIQQNILTS